METHLLRGQTSRTYYPNHNTEFQGSAPDDAVSTELAVKNAVSTIRSLLTEERRKKRRQALPDLAPHISVEHLEPVANKSAVRRISLWSRIKTVHLLPRHMGWLALFVLVLWQPLPVLIAMFIGFWMVFLGYAIFGADRVTQLRIQMLRRMARSLTFSRRLPKLQLRREAAPDPFADRPDPFERIVHEAR